MKKRLFFIFIILSLYMNAQDYKLSNFLKVELFLDKTVLGYELPISDNFLINLGLGLGGINEFDGSNNYTTIDDASLFLKGELRYYLNLKRRIKKGRTLENNSGSYIGFQTKFNSNNFNPSIGSVLMNEIHFGQQLFISERFYFNYNIGIGFGQNLKFGHNLSSEYPAINLAFGYRIF